MTGPYSGLVRAIEALPPRTCRGAASAKANRAGSCTRKNQRCSRRSVAGQGARARFRLNWPNPVFRSLIGHDRSGGLGSAKRTLCGRLQTPALSTPLRRGHRSVGALRLIPFHPRYRVARSLPRRVWFAHRALVAGGDMPPTVDPVMFLTARPLRLR